MLKCGVENFVGGGGEIAPGFRCPNTHENLPRISPESGRNIIVDMDFGGQYINADNRWGKRYQDTWARFG